MVLMVLNIHVYHQPIINRDRYLVDFPRRNAVINACATGSCWEAALAALGQKNLQGPGGGITKESVVSR